MYEVKQKTILVVDDTPANVSVLTGLLKDQYKTKVATNGAKALRLAAAEPRPDLILLDIMMPQMDGYAVCEQLKQNAQTRAIPVIFLTAKTEIEDEIRGLALGAVDYITKPISPPIVLARVATQLELKTARDFLREQNVLLEHKVQIRTRELSVLQDVVMVAMGSLAESRDPETGNHIRRTQQYVKILAQALCEHPRFSAYLSPENIEMLCKSAPLHDIGKVGVPDHILLKPGKLTADEFEQMKKHTNYGRDAIVAAESSLETETSFLTCAREIAYSHQEKWDGSGYPEGLSGDDIPISARLMAVADVYDALISRRVYKPPFPHEKAVEILRDGRGTHFDPDMIEAFLDVAPTFYAVAQTYADSQQAVEAKAGIATGE